MSLTLILALSRASGAGYLGGVGLHWVRVRGRGRVHLTLALALALTLTLTLTWTSEYRMTAELVPCHEAA